MQFTKRSEYAILSALYLAKNARVCDISEIAESQKLSVSFAAKTLQALTRAGILISKRGVGGGYSLARSASKINLLDLVEAVEGQFAVSDCLREDGSCNVKECLLESPLAQVQEAVVSKLKSITLASILAEEVRLAPGKNPVILCDFDGTISTRDVSDTIFTIWLKDKWTDIDWEWHEGKISMVELYEKCWSLVDATEDELKAFVDKVEIDPHFSDFVLESEKYHIPIYLVSDGFDYFIDRILGRYGHQDIKYYANHLFFEDGKPALEFNNQHPECIQCANCKKVVMDAKRKRAGFVIYIGNGLSDRCAAEHADLVFAKDSLLKHCKDKGIACVPYRNFGEIVDYLKEKGVFGR